MYVKAEVRWHMTFGYEAWSYEALVAAGLAMPVLGSISVPGGCVPDDGVTAEPADQGVGHRVILASLE